MKASRNIKIALLSALLLVIGCEKEPVDYRDKFSGKWRGTWSYETPYYHQEGMYCYRHFVNGYTETEMNVNGNWRSQVVDIYGSTYSYQPFEVAGNTCGVMSIVTVSGSGTLTGDTLRESGQLMFTVNLTEYSGTWTAKMVKDK